MTERDNKAWNFGTIESDTDHKFDNLVDEIDDLINELRWYGNVIVTDNTPSLKARWYQVTIPLILKVSNCKKHELFP